MPTPPASRRRNADRSAKRDGPAAATRASPTRAATARPRSSRRLRTAAPVETVQADTAERTITVDNGLVRAVFSNRGATLSAWELLELHGPGRQARRSGAARRSGKPAEAVFAEARRRGEDRAAEHRAVCGRRADAALGAMPSTSMRGPRPSRWRLNIRTPPVCTRAKQFRIEPNSYVVTVTAHVTDGGQRDQPVRFSGDRGSATCWRPVAAACSCRCARSEAIFSIDGDVERIAGGRSRRRPRDIRGTYEFAGVDTHYFISAAVKPGSAELEYYPLSIPSKTADAGRLARLRRLRHPLPAGAERRHRRAILRRTEALRVAATTEPTPISCARSGSACLRFSACRCCRR